MSGVGVSLRCPSCGFTEAVDVGKLREAGEAEAAKITDEEMDRRYRGVLAFCVRAVLPVRFHRGAELAVGAMPARLVREVGQRALSMFLEPVGGAGGS